MVLWTGFIVVSRIGGTSELTNWDIMGIRYLVAGSLLGLWFFGGAALTRSRTSQGPAQTNSARSKLLTPKHIALAILGGLVYAVLAKGFALALPPTQVVLPGSMPFFASLWAYLILGEKPKRLLVTPAFSAALPSCLGCCPSTQGTVLLGDLCFLGASAAWTAYSALLKRWQIPPLLGTQAVGVLTAFVFVPVWLIALPSGLAQASWATIGLQALYQGVLAAVIQMILFIMATVPWDLLAWVRCWP